VVESQQICFAIQISIEFGSFSMKPRYFYIVNMELKASLAMFF